MQGLIQTKCCIGSLKGEIQKFNLEIHTKDIKLGQRGKQFLILFEDSNLIIWNVRSERDFKVNLTFIGELLNWLVHHPVTSYVKEMVGGDGSWWKISQNLWERVTW